MPEMFDHYYEPFVGGGALFFHMRSHGLLMDNQVTISDANLRLIRTYKAVRDDVEGLIERLTVYKERHGKEFYYDLHTQVYELFELNLDVLQAKYVKNISSKIFTLQIITDKPTKNS